MGKLFKVSPRIAYCPVAIYKSNKGMQWIYADTQYKQSINQIKSWIKYMNRRMNMEEISILYFFIAQYERISQKESFKALSCIVEPLNSTWKDAGSNLYKESVKKKRIL